jgi:hypothetical protein
LTAGLYSSLTGREPYPRQPPCLRHGRPRRTRQKTPYWNKHALLNHRHHGNSDRRQRLAASGSTIPVVSSLATSDLAARSAVPEKNNRPNNSGRMNFIFITDSRFVRLFPLLMLLAVKDYWNLYTACLHTLLPERIFFNDRAEGWRFRIYFGQKKAGCRSTLLLNEA